MAHMGAALQLLDRLLLTLFVCELLLKLAGHGLRFFRSGWNQMAGVAAGISEHLN